MVKTTFRHPTDNHTIIVESIKMDNLSIAKELLQQKKFSEVSNCLFAIETSELTPEQLCQYHFLLASTYDHHENPGIDPAFAKDNYQRSIKVAGTIPDSYLRYAALEEDPNVSLNYLRLGHSRFPANVELFQELFKREDKREQEKLALNCVKTASITNYLYLQPAIKYFFDSFKRQPLIKLFSRILRDKTTSSDAVIFSKTLLGYLYIIGRGEHWPNRAIKNFQQAIGVDIDNELHYSHYLGLVAAYIDNGETDKANEWFDKIPATNSIDGECFTYSGPFVVPIRPVYDHVFSKLLDFYKNDEFRFVKVKCLHSCYLFSDCGPWNEPEISTDDVANIEKFWNLIYSNILGEVLISMKILCKDKIGAWDVLVKMTSHYYNDDEHFRANMILGQFDDSSFLKLVETVKKNIKFDTKFIKNIIDAIVPRLHKMKEYKHVVELAKAINPETLKKTDCLFEFAYALNEVEDPLSEQLYLWLIKAEPRNAAALNNLAVIYKHLNDHEKSYQYFFQAYQLESKSELYHRNLLSVSNLRKKAIQVCALFKAQNPSFKRKILEFSEYADEQRRFNFSTKELAEKSGLPISEVDMLWLEMLDKEYVIKTLSKSTNVYYFNSYIWEYLQNNSEKLKSNIEYELISEKLHIDNLNGIGYNGLLCEKLNSITEKKIREMLLRDLRECAISITIESYKSAMVVAGGAIEHLLTRLLLKNGIKSDDVGTLMKKTPSTKKVEDMNLAELLEVAKHKNLLPADSYHLSQIARKYRNIIHPTVEAKISSEVNEENALLLWKVLIRMVENCL